jgi:hypothetical protein
VATLREELLDQAIEFWQTRTPRTLTREDAREIVENLTGFFDLLLIWEAAEEAALQDDATSKVAPT